jgi:hypothetical protein
MRKRLMFKLLSLVHLAMARCKSLKNRRDCQTPTILHNHQDGTPNARSQIVRILQTSFTVGHPVAITSVKTTKFLSSTRSFDLERMSSCECGRLHRTFAEVGPTEASPQCPQHLACDCADGDYVLHSAMDEQMGTCDRRPAADP